MANNVIELNCKMKDTYHKPITHFKTNAMYYHTYQLKEERSHRVVLKYLHHSRDVKDIRQELFDLGHTVRNIINVYDRITNEPLNLFFVDVETTGNNKDIHNITALQNKIIQIERPRVNKRNIPQCARCQQYGHTRTYCNKPFACVKCGVPTTAQTAISEKMCRRNALYAAEITLPTTNDACVTIS
jgi:PAX-interacting protein 1